jgi:hypothetical protein
MSMLTGRELDFLASLRTSWHRLYLSEVERLLKEVDECDDHLEPSSIDPPFIAWQRLRSELDRNP